MSKNAQKIDEKFVVPIHIGTAMTENIVKTSIMTFIKKIFESWTCVGSASYIDIIIYI